MGRNLILPGDHIAGEQHEIDLLRGILRDNVIGDGRHYQRGNTIVLHQIALTKPGTTGWVGLRRAAAGGAAVIGYYESERYCRRGCGQ